MPESVGDFAAHFAKQKPAILLGAGASIPSGAPSAAKLTELLAQAFKLTLSDQDYELSQVAEILEVKHGRRPVVELIKSKLKDLKPVGGLSAIPSYPWRAVYTTNFDLLIEAAYKNYKKDLTVVRSDYDYPSLDLYSGTQFFKMHGCITQDRCFGDRASMVLTDSDYHTPSKYRDSLMKRLELDIFSSGLIIVGHSFRDKHFSDLVRSVAELQRRAGYVNRIGLLSYERDPNRALIYETLKILVSFGGIDEFMDALLKQDDIDEIDHRKCELLENEIHFPNELLPSTYIVSQELTKRPSVVAVFNGKPATYADIGSGFTFDRNIETILSARHQSGDKAMPIIGVAGVGKTTAARRYLFQCNQNKILSWEHKKGFGLNAKAWLEVDNSLRSKSLQGILLLDDVTSWQAEANILVDRMSQNRGKDGLRIISTAQTSQWVPRQKSKEFFTSGDPLVLSRLESDEITRLVRLTNDNESIRNLLSQSFKAKTIDEQKKHINQRALSDMFVSMKVLFGNETLDEILLKEYADLPDDNLKDIYRYVSALEACGLLVHRQLILRILNFETSLLPGYLDILQGLVDEVSDNSQKGIYIWETRHQRVAQIIAQYKFAGEHEFLKLMELVIPEINPTLPIERKFIADICTSEFGIKRLSQPEDRIKLYEMLISIDPTHRVPRHRVIYELVGLEDLDGANAALTDAIDAVGLDSPLQRYKVVLILSRVNKARLPADDRIAMLRNAYDEAKLGIKLYPDSMYQPKIFDDVARCYYQLSNESSWLKESEQILSKAYDDILDPELLRWLTETQRFLRTVSQ